MDRSSERKHVKSMRRHLLSVWHQGYKPLLSTCKSCTKALSIEIIPRGMCVSQADLDQHMYAMEKIEGHMQASMLLEDLKFDIGRLDSVQACSYQVISIFGSRQLFHSSSSL